jgi:hypothetical protein
VNGCIRRYYADGVFQNYPNLALESGQLHSATAFGFGEMISASETALHDTMAGTGRMSDVGIP